MNSEMRASNYETRMDNEVVLAVFKWTGAGFVGVPENLRQRGLVSPNSSIVPDTLPSWQTRSNPALTRENHAL